MMRIHHQVLIKLLEKRIADKRFLSLIERFLKSGIMEGRLFKRTDIGTPQGGICSPILANIYLHQLDLFWWNKYGNLHRKEKERRRTKHLGNCALIRYADDWLLLTNGGKAEAIRLKDEFKDFLWSELKLELSPEKTRITHVNQGFDFLGFHVQRYVNAYYRPKMLVTPAQDNIKKLKLKIKEMTRRNSLYHIESRAYKVFNKETNQSRYTSKKLLDIAFPKVPYSQNKHVNVKGEKSPYDGDIAYWSKRNSILYDGATSKALKRQNHSCDSCGLKFLGEQRVHLHHVDGNHQNWKESNLVAIHQTCHQFIHMKQSKS